MGAGITCVDSITSYARWLGQEGGAVLFHVRFLKTKYVNTLNAPRV
jgi:hypothetical protein